MQIQFSLPGLVVLAVSAAGGIVQAQQTSEAAVGVPLVTREIVEARQNWQRARQQLYAYRFAELPARRRLLDDEIQLASAEIAVLRRRLADYRPFLEVGRYSPARTAAQSHLLALIAAEQRLRQLKEERIALMRFGNQKAQRYELQLVQAAQRLREAQAAESIPQ